jgi:site-specific DNA recombinase
MLLDEYQCRRRELEQQAQQLSAQADHKSKLTGLIDSVEDFRRRVQLGLSQATFEQKRQLLELLVDRVVVTHEEVEIRYVIPTSPKSEKIRFCQLRSDYFDLCWK